MKKIMLATLALILMAALGFSADTPDKTKWPAKYLDPATPVFTAGKFKGWNNWGGEPEGNLFMLIDGVTQADLDKYVKLLVAAGFHERSSDYYAKGLYGIGFQFNSKTILQISCRITKDYPWPAALIPGVPVLKKGYITGIIEPSEDMPGYVQLYFIDLKQAELEAWFKELGKAGFKLEDSMYAKKTAMKLGGKTFKFMKVSGSENGDDEWMLDFDYYDDEDE